MSLKNNQQSGFTIVELLIVVVVIAILAAITIVSYTGITAQANASAAASTANSIMKKATAFATAGPSGTYPRALSDITGTAAMVGVSPSKTTTTSDTWYITGVTWTATPVAATGKTTMSYYVCGYNSATPTVAPTGAISATNPSVVTGGQIRYYDYETGSGVKTLSFGNTTATANPNIACLISAS